MFSNKVYSVKTSNKQTIPVYLRNTFESVLSFAIKIIQNFRLKIKQKLDEVYFYLAVG